jgi:hypothetical protein
VGQGGTATERTQQCGCCAGWPPVPVLRATSRIFFSCSNRRSRSTSLPARLTRSARRGGAVVKMHDVRGVAMPRKAEHGTAGQRYVRLVSRQLLGGRRTSSSHSPSWRRWSPLQQISGAPSSGSRPPIARHKSAAAQPRTSKLSLLMGSGPRARRLLAPSAGPIQLSRWTQRTALSRCNSTFREARRRIQQTHDSWLVDSLGESLHTLAYNSIALLCGCQMLRDAGTRK